MKLAAERNLNKYLFPVISLKGKTIQYPVKRKYNTAGFLCVNGRFGPKNWMILDILGTFAIHKVYNDTRGGMIEFKDRIPTPNDGRVKSMSGYCMSHNLLKYVTRELGHFGDPLIPDAFYSDECDMSEIDSQYGRIKKVAVMKLTDRYLRNQLPFMRRYSSSQICELVRQTSECMISMVLYIRYFDGKNYRNFPYHNGHCPCSFFTLVDVKDSKLSKDGHVLEREYEIRFDTLLGYFFIQNCVSCYTDLLPGKFYLMSDYAQLFYRMLILPYYKDIKNPLSIDEIRARLDLVTKDTYMVRKVVRRILDELESNSLIRDPKEIKPRGKYLYSYSKTPWKEIEK